MENQTVSTRGMKKAKKGVSKEVVNPLESATDDLISDSVKQAELVLKDPKCKKELTVREKNFVTHYIEHQVASRAARLAGFSDGVASTKAHNWIKADPRKNPKLHVFAAIYAAQRKVEKNAMSKAATKLATRIIDASFVQAKTVELIDKNNGDIPTHTTYHTDKDGETTAQHHYAYNHGAVAKGLELLGKHKEIKAFDNTVEHTAESSLSGLLQNLAPTTKPPTLKRVDEDISDGELVAPEDIKEEKTQSLLPDRAPNGK